MATSKASYENIEVPRRSRILIEAGEGYVEVIEEILQKVSTKPRTCLLIALGGGSRGKTSTMNSVRGMPFVARHEPTEMAALSKFITEPGVRGLAEDIIAEFDFKENSLRANVSRLHEGIVPEVNRLSKHLCTDTTAPLQPAQPPRLSHDVTERPHADVIERVRRSMVQDTFPVGFNGSVVQVWDMAGQSQYEMVHSMVIARGSILLFVTDLERVADESTRESEVGLVCYWMQLARIQVPNPSRVRVLVVGTRRASCSEDSLEILKDCLAKQLAEKVYNSWIKKPLSGRCVTDIPKFIAIENSESLNNPKDSGLEELERAVKAACDDVVASRGTVPLRWLAFVDKLERVHRTSARIYFSRQDIRDICTEFPGFALCGKCFRPWSSTWWENFYWLLWHPWRLGSVFLSAVSTSFSGQLWPRAGESVIDLDGMQPVMTPRRYDVFISHAGPDKLTLAEPLYRSLAWHDVHTFLDMEGLQINEGTAPEAMVRAMREARIGIFILSPEFAAREWTLKELRHFLERNKKCRADGASRPVLLPVFYRLSIGEC